MRRREFLKFCSIAPFGMGFLAPGKPQNLFGCNVLAQVKKNYQKSCRVSSVMGEDGKEYYIAVMHPRQKYLLDVAVAKDGYKYEQWKKRYNRWRAGQGVSL